MEGKTKLIGFKATPKERAILDVLCQRENRTISEMLRECVREAAASRGLYSVGMVELMSKFEIPKKET